MAERMRPSSLDEVAGQKQLLGEGAPFRSLIDQDKLGSALFWGPPVSVGENRAEGPLLIIAELEGDRQDYLGSGYSSHHEEHIP